jgi:hypothetical protein
MPKRMEYEKHPVEAEGWEWWWGSNPVGMGMARPIPASTTTGRSTECGGFIPNPEKEFR